MSQLQRATLGAKRRYDLTEEDRTEGRRVPFSQQLPPSQSSDTSSSRHSSVDGRSSYVGDGRPRPARGLHEETPLQEASSSRTLPPYSLMNSAAYTLPPTSLMSPIPPRVSGQAFASQATNDPAIQTMQRDNTSLVSAYSSAQNRIAHLDEELRAAKLEIAKLAKERQKLNAKIDLLEAGVDELQNSIDLSQQDNAAKDNQYSQILKLATKLETHGVANAQHRKTEQQQWTHYRQDRETLIAMLMSEVKDLRSGIQRSTTSQSEASGLPGRDQGGLSGQSGALRHMNTRM